jgi:hypothetical protein
MSNVSYYDPADEVSRSDGSGGAPAAGIGGGAEGAGNVARHESQPPSLYCLPEAMSAARDCGAAMLVKTTQVGFFCGMSLGALRECLGSDK